MPNRATTKPSNQVLEYVVERLAELLSTQVSVLNDQGMIIASNNPQICGHLFEPQSHRATKAYVRLPLYLNGQVNEIVVTRSMQGETVSPRLLRGLLDLVIHQATTVNQLPKQYELKNKFIHDLLRGSTSHESDILRDAQILGMDLMRPRAVILIDAADYILTSHLQPFEITDHQIQRQSEFIISHIVSFFHLPSDTICAYIGNGEVAVLKASSSQDLAAWIMPEQESQALNSSWADLTALKRAGDALLTRLRITTETSISIGIGRYHPKIEGLAHSYQDARAALSLGKRLHGPNQLHCLDSLGIAAFVGISDEETKLDLARHLLSPLDQEIELLETLTVFFAENCCASTTAKQLSIHRNTLSYRLDKVSLLTGLDPRCFDDAMQIRLALLLRSLRGDTPDMRHQPRQPSPERSYLNR